MVDENPKNSVWKSQLPILLWCSRILCLAECTRAIQLKTTSPRLVVTSTVGADGNPLQDFIARPIHWPEIVLSSNRVEVVRQKAREPRKQNSAFGSLLRSISIRNFEDDGSAEKTPAKAITPSTTFETLEVGDKVEEYFALNQFKVEWTCTNNEPGRLVVVSPDGVPGIAKNCVMDFEFDNVSISSGQGETRVQLTMEYTPESPLAVLATPALVIDNWLALNVLLPSAVDARPLDSFRRLMGVLYGAAGLLHLLDLEVGGSRLFTEVLKIPSFENLNIFGQSYALLWCAVGPFSYYLSSNHSRMDTSIDDERIRISKPDLGLLLYAIVEVFGAILSSGMEGAANGVYNAISVQGVVFAAWYYSYRRQKQRVEFEVLKSK